jgi:hypothetical protein
MTLEFVWRGDPADDVCCSSVPGYTAHAECMSDGTEADDPGGSESWYCSVSRVDGDGRVIGDAIFHSGDHDTCPLTGRAARWLCELVIRAAVAGVYPPPPSFDIEAALKAAGVELPKTGEG